MSQLLRLILIHTHLPGVYEIELDQHSNICGTNASGKTTLQRLLPVFYGEQPNRVVPTARNLTNSTYPLATATSSMNIDALTAIFARWSSPAEMKVGLNTALSHVLIIASIICVIQTRASKH